MSKKIQSRSTLTVLSLEESDRVFKINSELMRDAGFDLHIDRVETEKDFTAMLRSRKYDIIFTDFKLPGFDGFAAVRLSHEICPEIPVICVSGSIGEETAIELIKQGAFDFVLKDKPDRLPFAIKRALNESLKKKKLKQAEEELYESEKNYRRLVDGSPDAIVIHSKGKIVFANRSSVLLMGASSINDMIGKSVNEFVHPDYREFVAKRMIETMKIGKALPIAEEKFIRLDGSVVDVEVKGIPVVYDKEPAMQVIIRDITDRKRSEETLLKLKKAVDNSGEVIFLTDRDGTFTFANPTFTSIYGFTADEIVGKVTPRILQSGLMKASEYKLFWETILSGKEVRNEYINKRKDGTLINVAGSATPIFDEKKNIIGFLGIQQDITKRKRTEEGLIESEANLQTIIDSTADGILAVNHSGKIIKTNKQFADLWRIPSTILASGDDELILNFVLDQLLDPEQFLRKVHELYNSRDVDFDTLLFKDGRVFERFSTPLLVEDIVMGRVWSFRDISDRKRSEEELEKNEKRYRAIVENVHQAYFETDGSSVFTYCNSGSAIVSGYSEEELLGMSSFRLVAEEHRTKVITQYRNWKNERREKISTEFLLQKKNGEKYWIEQTTYCSYDNQGSLIKTTNFIRNIEERKATEKQINMLAHALRSIGECVSITDMNDSIIFVNDAFCTTYGYEAIEVLGKNISMVRSPNSDRAKTSKILENTKKGGWRGELLNRKKNGEDFFVDLSTSIIRNDIGEGIALIGVAEDISERKISEELQLLFLTAFETAANGIVITNVDGTIVWVNKAFTKMTGYTLEEVLNKNPRMLNSGKQPNDFYKKLWETILSGNVWSGEIVNKRKDGTFYTDEMTITPVRDVNNVIAHFVAIKQDVTERIKSYEQIEHQALLLDEAHDAIILRDMDHRILYWNKGAERMYGWNASEVGGKDARELLFDDKTKHNEVYVQLLKEGLFAGEFVHNTKDKREITVDVRFSIIQDAHRNQKSILSIGTDITEKKKLESQYLRSQRLDSLGTLAGGIAHDLNNVLAPILLSIEVLKSAYVNDNTQKVLNAIESSARRGADIVKQILSFTRGAGMKKSIVQSRHLVNEIVTIIKETFPRSITVVNNIPKGVWTILGDPTNFHQIIFNLCVNARDAMPNGGTLTISAENKIIDEQYSKLNIQAKPGRYVMYSISDTGIGMSPDVLDKIYDPFFTTKELGKGTGLGLSTVHTIVHNHGGFIEAQSKLGEGTIFNIYIPASESDDSVPIEKKNTEKLNGNAELILVVDDEFSVCEVTKQILEFYNYRVITAANGAEALETYSTNRSEISLVITDMMMPVMDGANLILALKKKDSNIKIIVSSGLIDKFQTGVVKENGVNAFIRKPFNTEDLLMVVKRVLQ